jgi:hypothetical protein
MMTPSPKVTDPAKPLCPAIMQNGPLLLCLFELNQFYSHHQERLNWISLYQHRISTYFDSVAYDYISYLRILTNPFGQV